QLDRAPADHGGVGARLILRAHHHDPLRIEGPVRGVLGAGDQGRAVSAGVAADEEGGAGHGNPSVWWVEDADHGASAEPTVDPRTMLSKGPGANRRTHVRHGERSADKFIEGSTKS